MSPWPWPRLWLEFPVQKDHPTLTAPTTQSRALVFSAFLCIDGLCARTRCWHQVHISTVTSCAMCQVMWWCHQGSEEEKLLICPRAYTRRAEGSPLGTCQEPNPSLCSGCHAQLPSQMAPDLGRIFLLPFPGSPLFPKGNVGK